MCNQTRDQLNQYIKSQFIIIEASTRKYRILIDIK